MGTVHPRHEEWASAHRSAVLAETRVAQLAARHLAGDGPTPAITDLQSALILRNKASALLVAVVSECSARVGVRRIDVPPSGPPSAVGT